jgi:hypothetical protein
MIGIKLPMLTFISFFLAASAMLTTQVVHAGSGAGGGVFAVTPHFAKDDIVINQLKGFAGCPGENDNGRKSGEAFLSRQGMEKIREAVGLTGGHFAGGSANTGAGGGATVQATLISKTTPLHADSHWDSERTPMRADERAGFVVLNEDHEAYFNHDGTMVPLVQGSLVTFEGSIEHNTIVKSGSVLLAGPFDLATFENVGLGPCPSNLEGSNIGDGTDGTVTEAACLGDSSNACTICYPEPTVPDRRRELSTTASDGSWLRWLNNNNAGGRFKDEECPTTTGICSHLSTSGGRTQPGVICTCGLPKGAACFKGSDCCNFNCVANVCA